MKERRLFDFFNERFESALKLSDSMQAAYTSATDQIWQELKFIPYKSFESFNRLRKSKKKGSQVEKNHP